MSAKLETTTSPGAVLTEEILAAIAPIVAGKPSRLVVEALASATLAGVTTGCETPAERREVLLCYIDAIEEFL